MKYEVKNRWSGAVQFVAEIECDEGASRGIKMGLAVRWAVENDADLRDVNLRGAYLSGADLRDVNLRGAILRGAILRGAYLRDVNLSGADLSGANLRDAILSGAILHDVNLHGAYLSGAILRDTVVIDGGHRSDGYRFIGHLRDSEFLILAGCRYFPIADARKHWAATRGGTPLGDETMARLDMIEATAKARGLLVDKKAAA